MVCAGAGGQSSGHITFASFNYIAKINQDTIRLWAEVLRAVPGSELRLVVPGGPLNDRPARVFEACGIARQRIRLLDRQDCRAYWHLYSEVDIALDPFPYNGGVTTMDSLWMGLPVVTLPGERALSRAGLTILSHLGLPELIAHTRQQYVQIAAGLAGDLPRLGQLRRTLRQTMLQSPLMDAPAFARAIEEAYTAMWRR